MQADRPIGNMRDRRSDEVCRCHGAVHLLFAGNRMPLTYRNITLSTTIFPRNAALFSCSLSASVAARRARQPKSLKNPRNLSAPNALAAASPSPHPAITPLQPRPPRARSTTGSTPHARATPVQAAQDRRKPMGREEDCLPRLLSPPRPENDPTGVENPRHSEKMPRHFRRKPARISKNAESGGLAGVEGS